MKARDSKDVLADGFVLSEARPTLGDVGMLSLGVALRAYYSTYKSMEYMLHIFAKGKPREDWGRKHSTEYVIACTQTVIHMQHFAELFCKEALRSLHKLHADEVPSAVVFDKLLQGEALNLSELAGLRSTEFSAALARLCELVKADRFPSGKYDFILTERDWLMNLNTLRNRVLHRGAFVLHYPALDELMGRFAFPFVKKALDALDTKARKHLWRHPDLACKIEPMAAIADAYAAGNPDIGHIALLKELGRAAYQIPFSDLPLSKILEESLEQRYTRAAEIESKDGNIAELTTCPVCGKGTLLVFDDTQLEGEDYETGTYERGWYYTWKVECRCCSFEINHHLKNPSDYGLSIPDFWQSHEV